MKLYRVYVVCIALILILAACGKANLSNTASENGQTPNIPTAVAATTTATNNAPENEMWKGSDFANKLDTLDSYTATFTFTHTNTSSGNESAWVWQRKVIHNPLTVEIRINSKGTNIQSTDYLQVNTADKEYNENIVLKECNIYFNKKTSQKLDQKVFANPFSRELMGFRRLFSEPYSLLYNIPFAMQKTGAGPDVLGHATDAYSYTGTDAEGLNYQSTALVDRNDGYAMFWGVTSKTKNGDILVSWKYELSNINAGASITLPKECEAVESGNKWPIPDGAEVLSLSNRAMWLNSDKSIKELHDFYITAMEDAGYVLSSGIYIPEFDHVLEFKKDGKSVEVYFSKEKGNASDITEVWLSVPDAVTVSSVATAAPVATKVLAGDSIWTQMLMPGGAKITIITNEMMSYTTAKSVEEMAEFYTTAMKDAGYEVSNGAMNSTDSSLLPFKKDGKTITVIIWQQDGKSTVIITQQ